MFGRLARGHQERLLRRARKANEPIGHTEVARLDRKAQREPADVRTSAPPGDATSPSVPARPINSPAEPEEVVLRLTRDQVRQIIVRLGGTTANELELVDNLLALLAESAG